ncbi:MAG: DUF3131 domain-containing protein [Nostocales cyanobacterium 94392]|nr:DUF3131 domain-containing protein [Nostocales cyanobacterium 94392]
MTSNFDPPPKSISIFTVVAGLVTAVVAIVFLNQLSGRLEPKKSAATVENSNSQVANPEIKNKPKAKYAKLDAQSMQLPGSRVTAKELSASKSPYIPPKVKSLTSEEMEVARQAWKYFERNWNEDTGLVNSVDDFTSVTLWDQSAAMAALVSAKELKLIPEKEFEKKMSQMLKTLAKLPLYNDELPNKVYNSKTLLPVNYGQLNKKEEIGWSAIDLGRMALWLKIVGSRYPRFQKQTQAVWKSWQVERLTKDGEMYGTSVIDGKEQYNQEGRLGYENYAAFGLKLWGLDVKKSLDYQDKAAFVNLYGKGIPYDIRDAQTYGANNYVLSEPYFLDGIETGFQALPKAYADRMLDAQEARYKATNQLTAITEDNLDREPYFVYNTLFVNGKPWGTITDKNENYNHLRFLSTKAAIGWHMIYRTDYTQKMFEFVHKNLQAKDGIYNGYYETLQEPNKALTANNNGIVLQSLLYKNVGQPLIEWAKVKPTQ